MLKLKSTKQVIRELETEIKSIEMSMEDSVNRGYFGEAHEYKNTICTLNFVIDLIKGKLG
jgi:hypothetical protein